MIKLRKLCLICVMSLLLVGCNKDNKNDGHMYHNLEKLDDYLYKVEFDDYRYDEKLETVKGVEAFACSSVKNGNYYGRNFDFIFNDVTEFVVKVKASDKRHASIGIVNNSDYRYGDDFTSKYIEKMELIPNNTMDGINDQGVIASINVVPKEDVAPITGTNPDGEKLNSLFIVRYILDNADSAADAINLLKEKNIYGSAGEHYNIHVMIADKNKTYVVEFIDNKMVYDEKIGNEQIMTNYYVNLPELTENAAGVERYKILQDNYSEGSSFEGMWNLLQRVRYSNEYLFDKDVEWYSEFVPQSMVNDMTEERNKIINEQLEEIKRQYWVAKGKDQRNPAIEMFWHTTHNSTYDIEKRKIRITVQENYKQYFEFTL